MTKIHIEPKWSSVKPCGNYVYIHKRMSDGTVFYVGRGKGRRAWLFSNRSLHWKRVAIKNGVYVEIIKSDIDISCSKTLEIITIALYMNNGCRIVNISDGGEGRSGVKTCALATENMIKSLGKKVYSSLGEVFSTVADAGRAMEGIGYGLGSAKSISSAANGKRKTACGRAWSYNCMPEHPVHFGYDSTSFYSKERRSKAVLMDDEIVFSSGKDASDFLSSQEGRAINSSYISKACSSGLLVFGHKFRYLDVSNN